MTLNTVKRYIAQSTPLQKDDKIIVAVSGGADSICLAHMLLSLGYCCEIAHCNFHLRGEESDRDELFVTEFANRNNVKIHKTSFRTADYAHEKKLSIEMAARELRYEWFEATRKANGAQYIAVAHHRDDSAETFLMNLTRGAGLKGLCGIQAENGRIIRPLLCLSRKQILEYLQANGLTFVEDSTNNENVYTRNKFRNEIIPELEKINPATKENIAQTIEYLNEVRNIYDAYIEQHADIEKRNGPLTEIDLVAASKTLAPQSVLYETLKKHGFNTTQCHEIYDARKSNGKVFFANGNIASTSRGKLFISRQEAYGTAEINENTTKTTFAGIEMRMEHLSSKDFTLVKDAKIGCFDMEKLQFPLLVRQWKKGDFFHPIGIKNRKLLSDFFIDNKISVAEKTHTAVLVSGNGDIVWVMGMRPDDRYKVTENTKKILKITL